MNKLNERAFQKFPYQERCDGRDANFINRECYKCGATEQRDVDSKAVMDLYHALRSIKGTPTLRDLLKLAKRIRGGDDGND